MKRFDHHLSIEPKPTVVNSRKGVRTSTTKTGLEHPLWRGGAIERKIPGWESLRSKTIRRDNFTCQDCKYVGKLHKRGKTERSLHVHHINGYRFEKWDKNNPKKLITLCSSCHLVAEQKLMWRRKNTFIRKAIRVIMHTSLVRLIYEAKPV